jgi:hypothetical protein
MGVSREWRGGREKDRVCVCVCERERERGRERERERCSSPPRADLLYPYIIYIPLK